MPTTSAKIRKYLNIEESSWNYVEINENIKLENIEALFNRL